MNAPVSTTTEYATAFRDAMAAAGIPVRADIIADGKIHRYHVEGDRKGSRSAWAILHLDDQPTGAFGSIRSGRSTTKWSAKGAKRMSAAERKEWRDKMQAEQKRRADEDSAARATLKANAIWDAAAVVVEHPYLTRKGIAGTGLRVAEWVKDSGHDVRTGEGCEVRIPNALLVPLRNRRKQIVSLQAIFEDSKNALNRDKDFLSGGEKRGCWFTIGKPAKVGDKDTVVLCEGYATGATINAATDLGVVVCFDAGNLQAVAEIVRKLMPDAVILIAADNDRWTNEPIKNPGVTRAGEAAAAVGGLVAVPEFKSLERKPTDFNDLYNAEGLPQVKEQIMRCLDRTALATRASTEIKPQRAALPCGFRMTNDGVQHRDEKNGDRWEFVFSPLEVIACTRNSAGSEWGRLLRITDQDGRTKDWAMPMSMMAGDGAAYREQLLSLGMVLAPGRRPKDALHTYIATAKPNLSVRCVSRIGWHDGTFILPHTSIGPIGGENILFQASGAPDSAFRESGTLESWQSYVAAKAVGNPHLMFAISVGFAAALLDPLGAESGGIHFYGSSSTGKSTLLVAAGSVWGGGGVKGYVRQWRATDNGLEGIAMTHCDALLVLDELGQADSNTAAQSAYMLANGGGKNRATRSGDAKPGAEWRSLFLSSGELSLGDKIAEDGRGRKIAAGQQVRVVDLPADAGAGMGVFGNIHDSEDASAFATTLKEDAKRHYGVAWRPFVRAIADGPIEVARGLTKRRDKWLEVNVPASADGQVKRVAARFALIAAAGEFASERDIVPWPLGDASEAAGKLFRAWLDHRGGKGSAEAMDGVRRLRNFIEAHGASRFQLVGADFGNETEKVINRAGYRRRDENNDWEYLFLRGAWNEEICRGFRKLNQVLIDRGFLKPDSGGKASRAETLPGMGKTRVYVVTAKLMADDT